MIKKEEKKWKTIPFSLIYEDSPLNKPVTFFFHGFMSDHKKGPMGRDESLAEMGHVVVAMDAPGHGGRHKAGYQGRSDVQKQAMLIDIVIETAHDATNLYHHLIKESIIDAATPLIAYGVSMGGHTAFFWGKEEKDVDMVIALLGSPSFVDFYHYKQTHYGFHADKNHQERTTRYETIDPLRYPGDLTHKKVFAATGEDDTTVPAIYAKKLSKRIDMTYVSYPTAHQTTPRMINDAHTFIKKALKEGKR